MLTISKNTKLNTKAIASNAFGLDSYAIEAGFVYANFEHKTKINRIFDTSGFYRV